MRNVARRCSKGRTFHVHGHELGHKRLDVEDRLAAHLQSVFIPTRKEKDGVAKL